MMKQPIPIICPNCGLPLNCNYMVSNFLCVDISCPDCDINNFKSCCKCDHVKLYIEATNKIASLEAELVRLRKDNIKLNKWYNDKRKYIREYIDCQKR